MPHQIACLVSSKLALFAFVGLHHVIGKAETITLDLVPGIRTTVNLSSKGTERIESYLGMGMMGPEYKYNKG